MRKFLVFLMFIALTSPLLSGCTTNTVQLKSRPAYLNQVKEDLNQPEKLPVKKKKQDNN